MNALPLMWLGLGMTAGACIAAIVIALFAPHLLDTQTNRLLTVGYYGGLLMAGVGSLLFCYFLWSQTK